MLTPNQYKNLRRLRMSNGHEEDLQDASHPHCHCQQGSSEQSSYSSCYT